MELKKHQLRVVMGDVHDVIRMYITDHNGLIFVLQKVTPEQMTELQKKPMDGLPTAFCFLGTRVVVYPRPDKDYENVTIDYLPEKRSL